MQKDKSQFESRIREVRRLFDEYGLENIADIQDWDGSDISDLAEFLTEDEYQKLLDDIADWESARDR